MLLGYGQTGYLGREKGRTEKGGCKVPRWREKGVQPTTREERNHYRVIAGTFFISWHSGNLRPDPDLASLSSSA